ncbi:SAM-dependent methyltransferase [Paenibacillus sp. Soil787]|uniref:SAM-dependent methyltransferase n=1 Tax=Paenibacillus sp. Soil787 TaxID=1736411 RepID=UPI000703075E|nr:SAM-dependent methyltransferase [Paenibacillus sp. Soil787]KRF13427.1 hypothetical protein ASG93_12875 [Paenibacillus sp. Soil787]
MTHRDQKIYRFSKAPIWELQRRYYEEQGIRAWQSEEVPQYITSNPSIAVAYAEIIFGFLQDRAKLGYTLEPVTILELGAGSGRLAYHIVKELCELRDYASITLPPFRYVMSDLAFKTITFWQQHRSLLPFVEQGVLDFAQFDADLGTELHLTHSGDRIRTGDLQQPLLVIANYFFDSIPQELIYVDENKIYECMISLHFPEGDTERSAADMLKSVIPEYHYRRADEYEQESYPYREVVGLYSQKLEDSHILFPAVGLQCLERLGQLSQEGFLLLTADKGDHRIENWEYNEPPKLIHHGSFSLTANYHAIRYVFEQKGAMSLFTSHPYNHLNIGCMLMLPNPHGYGHTRLAYRRFVERFGPDDFFSIKEWFDSHLDLMEINQLLAFWRLGGYDAQLFLQSAKRLSNLIPDCDEEELSDIRQGILLMWEGYYPMELNRDLALDCAMLLYQMDMFQDALLFFERTNNEYRNDASVLYEMAICYYEVGENASAREFARNTLELAPEHEGALALMKLFPSL